jgi:hypothetical protein
MISQEIIAAAYGHAAAALVALALIAARHLSYETGTAVTLNLVITLVVPIGYLTINRTRGSNE